MHSSQGAHSASLPKISVVVPIYNASAWIRESLESVVGQTYSADLLELLAVDDGSTDDSADIVDSYLDSMPFQGHLIRTKRGGPSRARNIGWRQAQGEWIQFLDADDLLHPEKIIVQAKAAASLAETVAVIYSSWRSLRLAGREWLPWGPVKSPMVDHDPVADLLKSEGFLPTGSGLFRRTALERVGGYDERYWLIEDVDLLLRMAMAGGDFHRVETNQPLFLYRRGLESSLSQQDSRSFVEGCVRNADLVESFCRERDAMTKPRAEAITSVYFQAARQVAEWDRERFASLVQKLEAVCPGFEPPGPARLRWLSRLIGYPKAEMVAVSLRRGKRMLGRGTLRRRAAPGVDA